MAKPGHGAADRRMVGESPSQIELLELEVDLRLADLWAEISGHTDWSIELVAALLRAAYAEGYCDALTEEEPGALCREHEGVADALSQPPGSGRSHL
jgi:hypothetical protein